MYSIKREKRDNAMEIGPMMPSFHISFKDFPDAKDWKPGNKYRIIVDVEQSSMNIHKDKGKEDGGASFTIEKIGGMPAKSKRYKRENYEEE